MHALPLGFLHTPLKRGRRTRFLFPRDVGKLVNVLANETFSIGEVAAMVGVSTDSLRAWERRYNVISPLRTPKNQRRYSADDVRMLARISETCMDGVRSVQQAVMTVKGLLPEGSAPGAAEVSDGQPLWREVLDRSGVPMLIVDVGGRIIDVNKVLLEVLGRSREAVQGRKVATIVSDEDRDAVPAAATPVAALEIQLKTPAAPRRVLFDCKVVRQADDWFQVYIGRGMSQPAG
jgi:PAS domain-containing protein